MLPRNNAEWNINKYPTSDAVLVNSTCYTSTHFACWEAGAPWVVLHPWQPGQSQPGHNILWRFSYLIAQNKEEKKQYQEVNCILGKSHTGFSTHGMLKLMLPCELRTWKSNKWHCKRWCKYRMGHAHSTVCVCIYLCCGVARLTKTRISQHTPWGSTLLKKKRKNKQRNDRKYMINPLIQNISKTKKSDQPKHPKNTRENFPQADKDPGIQTDGVIETLALGGGQRCPHQSADMF